MYLMYLRKSRADNPDESVEEVLNKHETILQEFCERQFGYRIAEQNIYREVVSGESIADRIEIKKVLAQIEDSSVEGIIVIEPQRLSRGDLIDCGTLINTLQFTNTKIITPVATYRMDNKMERRFFQDELLRGRDYLEYTKEILLRGKLASVNRGCYIQSVAPYGYDKIKIGKDYTLTPNSCSEAVQTIFQLFADGKSSWDIARYLESLGIKSPRGHSEWSHATIEKILRNKHYIGKVTYLRDKSITSVVDGKAIKKRQRQKEYIEVEGKHPAIIDDDTFNAVQKLLQGRPPVQKDKILRNAFAGIMFCERCGKIISYKDKSGINQYLCCKTKGCSKSIKYQVMVDTVIEALEKTELPNLTARFQNGDGTSAHLQKKILKELECNLKEMKEQEETQYDLLERKQYTQELFNRRNKALRDKMKDTEQKIEECRRTMPNAIDFQEKIATLQNAIELLKNRQVSETVKNQLLKTIIKRIDINSKPISQKNKTDISLKISLLL